MLHIFALAQDCINFICAALPNFCRCCIGSSVLAGYGAVPAHAWACLKIMTLTQDCISSEGSLLADPAHRQTALQTCVLEVKLWQRQRRPRFICVTLCACFTTAICTAACCICQQPTNNRQCCCSPVNALLHKTCFSACTTHA